MAHGQFLPEETGFSARDLVRTALYSAPVTGPDLLSTGKNPPPTRQSTDPTPVMAIFGGITEIMKEIVGRSLDCKAGPALYGFRANDF
jgi:hypothetical protein